MIFKPEFSSSDIPLYEYPRPQFKRDSYFSLNGKWQYAICDYGKFNGEYEGEILVPYSPESALSGVNKQLRKTQELHYRRVFTLPDGFNEGKVFLNVGACDQICSVFLNGKRVGSHEGGYLSFSFDITDLLTDGENELTFTVVDDADSADYGRGKQVYKRGGIWYTAISGIWQSVWLESTPDKYLSSLKILPDFDKTEVYVTPYSPFDEQVTVEILGDDGEVIFTQTGRTNTPITLPANGCKPWTPDSPQLYPIVVKMGNDEVQSYFGLRTFSTKKIDGILYPTINGEPIFHNGLLDQGYFHDGIYTPSANKVMYDEVKAVKDMGFNMLRKHIKIELMLWYYYCDILGVLVWQDMINGGEKYKALRIMLAPFFNLRLNDKNYESMGRPLSSREQYMREAEGEIEQLFNCVALCVWTPFNEAWGQFDSIGVWQKLKQIDGSRLYDHASGWQDNGGGDFCSKHIYFKKAKPKNDGVRVLALSEFGGYSLSIEGHTFTDKKFGYKRFSSPDKLMDAYEKLYNDEVIPAIQSQGLSATVYTQLTDVEDEVNGLFTYDRVIKVDAQKIKDINEKVYKAFNEKTRS